MRHALHPGRLAVTFAPRCADERDVLVGWRPDVDGKLGRGGLGRGVGHFLKYSTVMVPVCWQTSLTIYVPGSASDGGSGMTTLGDRRMSADMCHVSSDSA